MNYRLFIRLFIINFVFIILFFAKYSFAETNIKTVQEDSNKKEAPATEIKDTAVKKDEQEKDLTVIELPGKKDARTDPTKKTKEVPIVCNGDVIEFYQENKKVVAKGNVVITYQEMKMTCDEAEVDMLTKDAYAKGNVVFTKKDLGFKGDKFKYNFEKKIGSASGADIIYKPWYGRGHEISKLGEKDFDVKNGYLTTCNRPSPHYKLKAGRVKIYLDDRVELKNVIFLVGKVPLLYIPQYTHSLKDKHPGVTVMPGKRKEWGYYLLSWWKYYLNEALQGRVKLDYRQYQGMAVGFDQPVTTKKYGSGFLRYYYVKEGLYEMDVKNAKMKGRRNTTNPEGSTRRWHIQFRHKWDIDQFNTFTTEYYRASDSDFRKFYFPVEQRKEGSPESYILFSRGKENYLLNLFFRIRTNRWENVVEKLPQLNFDISNLQIFKSDIYYRGHYELVNFNRKVAHSGEDDNLVRIDTYNQIQYTKNLFGFFNISPFVGTEQTWYSKYLSSDKTVSDNHSLVRGAFRTGINLSTKFFKTFDVKSDTFDIHRLRHIITPSISYNYAHRPTVASAKLMQFDGVDSLSYSNAFSFSIENKLQTKRLSNAQLTSVDLLRLNLNTPYYIRPKGGKTGSTFGDAVLDFELKPYDWVYMQSKASWGTKYKQRFVKNLEVDLKAFKKDDKYKSDFADSRYDPFVNIWDAGLGYRYARRDATNLELDVSYKVLPKFKFRYYINVDLAQYTGEEKTNNRAKIQEFSVAIDLHCWIAEIVYTGQRDQGNSVLVAFRLKAFPETPLAQEFKYNEPAPGSQLRDDVMW